MAVKVIIGADMVPTSSNFEYFVKGKTESLIGLDLMRILKDADFCVFNLEVPLIDRENPINKCGPNLNAPTSTIKGIQKINPYFFTLANNHILDHGEKGLFSTIQTLTTAGIGFAGAGANPVEAAKPYIYINQGIKIGIYCCAEHEFSIVTEKNAGANPFDPLMSLDQIAELKLSCDYVIVLYHGGMEHYRYPSPYLQKVCRRIADKGANLVICQHSHCIGCQEKWRESTIVYGQGNFIFDYNESEFWKTGLLIKIDFTGVETNISYIPLKKYKEKVKLAEDKEAEDILKKFYNRSQEIRNIGFVEQKYDEFACNIIEDYMNTIKGKEYFLYKVINKLSGNCLRKISLKRKYDKKYLLMLLNKIECEAHRELLLCGINRKLLKYVKKVENKEDRI